jgi:hypothetical protein
MHHFCTYFDRRYLTRGLALHESLRRHCRAFTLWVLCLDEPCHDVLARLRLPGVRLIRLAELESDDPQLASTKANRSRVEYYFTCTPVLPQYVFDRQPEIERLSYLDADLFFFGDPAPLFDELGEASIGIIGHRFAPGLTSLEKFGTYNVGWLTFRRNDEAFRCLRWWRDRCLEWCYDRCEEGRFADQKYLDAWPDLFKNVAVLRHPGANVAPWNVGGVRVDTRRRRITVNGEGLIFFHFHALHQLGRWVYATSLDQFGVTVSLSRILRRRIYRPYIGALRRAATEVARAAPDEDVTVTIREHVQTGSQWSPDRPLVELWTGVRAGRYVLAVNGWVY